MRASRAVKIAGILTIFISVFRADARNFGISNIRNVPYQDGLQGRMADCNTAEVPEGNLAHITVGSREAQPRNFCLGYNAAGKIGAQVDGLGYLTEFQFDLLERITQVTSPLNFSTTLGYNHFSQLKQSVAPVVGKPEGSPLPDSIESILRYDGVGNVVGASIQNREAGIGRTGDGRPTVALNPDGITATCYAYNAWGAVETVRTGPAQEGGCGEGSTLLRYVYNSSGRLWHLRDALNNEVTYEYDSFDRVQRIINPDGTAMSNRYMPNRDLVDRAQVLDGQGVVVSEVQYKYDGLDRITEIKRVTIAQGGLFAQAFDAAMRALGLGPEDPTTTFQYQQNGLKTVVTQKPGPKGRRGSKQLVYEIYKNKFGQTEKILSKGNPRTTEVYYFYNARGDLERIEDRIRNMTTSYAYDPEGRVASITNPLGQVTSLRADSLGNSVRVAAAGGTAVEQVHNVMGLLEQVRTGVAGGAMTPQLTMTYDPANFRLSGIQDAGGMSAAPSYEPGTGRLSGFSGPGNVGRTLRILAWDAMNRPTRTQDALGTTWEYVYDSMGRIRLMSGQSLDNRWPKLWRRYRYNALGKIQDVMETIGQSPDELWAENAPSSDKVFSLISEARAQVERAENAAPAGGGALGGEADQACPALPQVVSAVGPSPNILSTVFLEYDGLGRVKKEERIIAADDSSYRPVKAYYDGMDNIVRLEMPSRMVLDFDYNSSNFLYDAYLKDHDVEKGKFSFVYYNNRWPDRNRAKAYMKTWRTNKISRLDQFNPLGKLRERTYTGMVRPGGGRNGSWQETRKFNNGNQLAASRHWARVVLPGNRNFDVTEVRRHSYDDLGRLSGWHWITNPEFNNLPFENLPPASNTPAAWGFAYNNQNHLTRDDDFFNVAAGHFYDGVGGVNRVQMHYGCRWGDNDILDCPAGVERHDDAYDLRVIHNHWVIAIDKNNHMKHHIMYDVFGRPAYFTDAERNLEVAYVYDGFDRLIKEFVIENCALTREREYIWSGDRLMQILDDPADDRPTRTTFFYEGNSLIPSGEYRKKGNDGKMFYYLTQADGSVAAVVDKDTAEVVEYYFYTPYGQISQVTDAAGTQTASARKTRFMFKGQLVSPESGWYLARGRIYAPELKQFLQTDGSVSHLGFANFGLNGGDPMN